MENALALQQKLLVIQEALKAPKDKKNEYGGYAYRTAEGILAAVKPYLKSQGCTVTMTDDILLVGDRYYIKAVATLSDGNTSISCAALAREAVKQGGMADGQITGATSSYARKYALCGLFAIDGNKDLDDIAGAPEKPTEKRPIRVHADFTDGGAQPLFD